MEECGNKDYLGKATQLINDLKSGREAGLAHLSALSSVIGRPIRVYEDDRRIKYLVSYRTQVSAEPVSIEFHQSSNNDAGHWTLPNSQEPQMFKNSGKNNCLFNVVAEQTGIHPDRLREETYKVMEKNMELLAEQIEEIENFQVAENLLLVIGGCPTYRGRSPEDAARVLDRSQGTAPHGSGNTGHPRDHVSNPNAGPNDPCVENYSRSGIKSGFYLIHDQNYVVHHALLLPVSQNAMDKLNGGSIREVIHIPHHSFPVLPSMGTWEMGESTGGPFPINQVTMVLGHHSNQQNNPDSDVHIQTCYPRK